MMTRIENKPGSMTPACRPMLMISNSISPRAFISAPIALASCGDSPDRRAAAQQATALPPNDASRMAMAGSSIAGSRKTDSWVFRPE